ncbi:MAG: mucoidy inhibitor MuiA family protein [Paracoccaceae bacterium]
MRIIFLFILTLANGQAVMAKDYYTSAPVVAATLYPDGAEVTRKLSLDLPAGRHRIFVPYELEDARNMPRVNPGAGVIIEALAYVRNTQPEEEVFFTRAQKSANENFELIEDLVEAQTDLIADAKVEIAALKAKLQFISSVAPPEDTVTVEQLAEMAELVQSGTADISAAIQSAQRQLRTHLDDLEGLQARLVAAQVDLERVSDDRNSDYLGVISVNLAKEQTAEIEIKAWAHGANWSPVYEISLDRNTSQISFKRSVVIVNGGSDPWTDVLIDVSTLQPDGALGPRQVYASQARIYEPAPVNASDNIRRLESPMMEMAPMMEETAMGGIFSYSGQAVSYSFANPVTVLRQEGLLLSLDQLGFDADVLIHASPRRDETAFTVARFTNDGPEPILPGLAMFFRDGNFVGQENIELIPAGADTTLPMGPIEGIRLGTVFLANSTGDTGFINRSNTREQLITVTIENLTETAQDVRTFYSLPFSEQEDLKLKVKTNPQPAETDFEDRRGVAVWDVALAPGEIREIDINISFDWAEGWELNWNR